MSGFFNNILDYFAVRYNNGNTYYQFGSQNSSFGDDSRLNIALNSSVVLPILNNIGEYLSKAEFYIETKKGDKIYDHPVISLINDPNPWQSKQDFLKEHIIFKKALGGNVVHSKVLGAANAGDINKTKYIYNLNINKLECEKEFFLKLSLFKDNPKELMKQDLIYDFGKGGKKKISFRELILFYDVTNGLTEEFIEETPSVMDAIYKKVVNVSLTDQSKNITILSNGREIISSNEPMTNNNAVGFDNLDPDEKKDIQKKVGGRGQFGMAFGQGKTITANVKWESMHINAKDLHLNEFQQQDSLAILNAFNYPTELHPLTNDKSLFGDDKKQAIRGLIETVIQHEADDIVNTFQSYFDIKEGTLKASFMHLPSMQSIGLEKNKALSEQIKNLKDLLMLGVNPDEAKVAVGLTDLGKLDVEMMVRLNTRGNGEDNK